MIVCVNKHDYINTDHISIITAKMMSYRVSLSDGSDVKVSGSTGKRLLELLKAEKQFKDLGD